MLSEGKKAPAFALESNDGKVSLADFAGKYVVIYFYPRDSTPGCTVEAEGFRDARAKLAKKNAEVVGVSRDSLASHGKFAEKYQLPFKLLSDPDAKMIKAYGAWGEKNMYGKKTEGIIRSTVIVAPDGKIAKIFPKVKAAGHAAEVLAALDELSGMIPLVEAPNEYEAPGPSLFLAGGITGCPGWQEALAELVAPIREVWTLLNPRRHSFDVNDPTMGPQQIDWEFRHLRKATAIVFWFPKETLCPITLYELGAWSMTGKKLFIGTHAEYQRREDVRLQTALARPELVVEGSLGELANRIISDLASR